MKLYMLGGGWSQLLVPQLPGRPQAPFSLAIGTPFPTTSPTAGSASRAEFHDADGHIVGEAFTAQFEAGLPPGIRAGASQPLLLAVGTHPEFPAPGRYTYKASIDGEPKREVSFEVATVAPAPAPAG